jgi:hypothetical protein
MRISLKEVILQMIEVMFDNNQKVVACEFPWRTKLGNNNGEGLYLRLKKQLFSWLKNHKNIPHFCIFYMKVNLKACYYFRL